MQKDSATVVKSLRSARVVQRAVGRRPELDPHEEHSGLSVAELLALGHVGVVIDEEAGDSVHEAGPVGAGDGEHVFGPGARVAATKGMLLPEGRLG